MSLFSQCPRDAHAQDLLGNPRNSICAHIGPVRSWQRLSTAKWAVKGCWSTDCSGLALLCCLPCSKGASWGTRGMSGEKQVSQEKNKSVRHASHPSRAAFACSSASVSRLHPCEQPRRVFAPSSSALQRPRLAPAGLGVWGGTSSRNGGRGFPERQKLK